jgi:Flp pilus assembly protein TadD
MKTSLICGLAVLLLAGCGKDDGAVEFEKAEAVYAVRDFGAAALFYGAAAAKNPTNFEARVKQAVALMNRGELPQAQAAVDSALALRPDSGEAVFVDGQLAYLDKDYARAKSDFDAVANASALSPALRSQALAARAVMEIAAGAFARSRLTLWRAVRLDRRNSAAWYHLGHLSRDTYRFEDAAIEQFGMAARLADDPVRAKAITREVIPALRESLRSKMSAKPGAAKRDPGASAKLVAEAEALAGKDAGKSAAKFAEAYAKDPLSYAAAYGHAKALAASAKTDRQVQSALVAFQDAIDQRPNSQETYRVAALAALRRRYPMRAEKFLSQALAHDPENRRTLDLYVQTLRRLGKTAEAKLYGDYLKEL